MKKGAHYSFLITSNFISRTKREIVGHFEIKGMTSVSFANIGGLANYIICYMKNEGKFLFTMTNVFKLIIG